MMETTLHKPRVEQPPEHEGFQHVKVNVLGRFMLPDRREFPCQVLNMSPGGLAMQAPVAGNVGDRVVAYLDHIGRVEGKIVRAIDSGFAMTLNATPHKRDKLASQLTWLANRHVLNLPEDRRHERVVPRNPFSRITLDDGREYKCKIIDMSLSGAAVSLDVRPAIGSAVTLGRMRARVVRHFDGGIAIEFATIQDSQALSDQFNL